MSNIFPFRGRGAYMPRLPVWLFMAGALAMGLYPASSIGAEETLPTGEKVLEKYIEAIGGRAVLEKLHNRVTKGTFAIVGMGATAKMTTYAASPQKIHVVIESDMLGKMESGTDGKIVWQLTTMMGPEIKKGSERAAILREAMFNGILQWKDLYKSAECVAVEEVDGKPCYKVVMTPKEGSVETVFYDKKTFFAVRMETKLETQMGTMAIVATASDYKSVDGMLIAHKVVQEIGGLQKIEMVTESVEHNVDIPADRFKVPDDIQDLLKTKEKSTKE